VLSLDHIHERGSDLFRAECELGLEGIVGKRAHGTYRTDGRATSWVKLKHPGYTQIRDRHELFNNPHGCHRLSLRPDLILR
jgi:ATP-dependent DNA ligase